MRNYNLDIELFRDMRCKMLRTIYRPVLAARTPKADHHVSKFPLHKLLNVRIYKVIHIAKEFCHAAIILQKLLNLFIQSVKLSKMLILSGILNCPTIKHIASTISAVILRNAFFICKAEDVNNKSCVSSQILQLSHLCKLLQHLLHIWILFERYGNQFPKVINSKRNTLQKMRLLLKISSEAVSSKYLQSTEQYKKPQILVKLILRDVNILLKPLSVRFNQFFV